MFGLGLNELLVLILIIILLNGTGFWPAVIRSIRELRGEQVDSGGRSSSSTVSEICYKMLGISPSAPWSEVERAYRQKAKIHHPDHGGDEDTMRALNDAYRQIKQERGKL